MSCTRETLAALVFGVVCILLTYLVSLLGNLLQAALSLFGVLSGPISAIFMIGLFLPWVNSVVGTTRVRRYTA